ncbi:MAG: hypothetical protein RI992_546, partial [Actinomycetota bacterium]
MYLSQQLHPKRPATGGPAPAHRVSPGGPGGPSPAVADRGHDRRHAAGRRQRLSD